MSLTVPVVSTSSCTSSLFLTVVFAVVRVLDVEGDLAAVLFDTLIPDDFVLRRGLFGWCCAFILGSFLRELCVAFGVWFVVQ